MHQEQLIKCNLRPLRIDSMPAQVATEYLTDPLRKMSASFRRACAQARQSHYVSTNEPKPIAFKLAQKLSMRPVVWLRRQLRRTEQRLIIARGAISRIKIDFLRDQALENIMMPLLVARVALIAELERREAVWADVAQSRRMNAKD